jgi:PAS domain S-box-containing protein
MMGAHFERVGMKHTLSIIVLAVLPVALATALLFAFTSMQVDEDLQLRLHRIRQDQCDAIVNELQARIETAYSILAWAEAKGYSKQECIELLNAVRFDETNYVWVHEVEPSRIGSAYMVVHPAEELVNRDLSGLVDLDQFQRIYYDGTVYEKQAPAVSHINPTAIFVAFNEVALTQGEGVVSYYWPKIIDGRASDIGYLKMSYVKYFPKWHWVLGVGAYADHVDRRVQKEQQALAAEQRELRNGLLMLFLGVGVVLVLLALVVSRSVAQNIKRYQQQLVRARNSLEESRQRLFDITLSSGDFIWEMTAKYKYTYVAGNTQALLGYSHQEITGQSMFDFVDPKQRQMVTAAMNGFAQDKTAFSEFECHMLTRAGESILVSLCGRPIFDGAGMLWGYRGTGRDITQRRREQEQNQRLQRELNQAQKFEAIGTLAAGVAHEINTPIQFVGDNLDFLSHATEDLLRIVAQYRKALESPMTLQQLKETLAHVDLEYFQQEVPTAIADSMDGIDRVGQIVLAMKEFSHMGSERKQPADLNKAIQNTLIITRNEYREIAGLEEHLAADLPAVPCIIGDIKQVILNLIVNATHAIGEAREAGLIDCGCLKVATWRQNGDVIFSITDNGTGIAEDARDKVFDQFFTTKDVGAGTGQGLSLAYVTIVEKHNGKMWFETQQDKGTTFYFSLPLDQPAAVMHEPEKAGNQA